MNYCVRFRLRFRKYIYGYGINLFRSGNGHYKPFFSLPVIKPGFRTRINTCSCLQLIFKISYTTDTFNTLKRNPASTLIYSPLKNLIIDFDLKISN